MDADEAQTPMLETPAPTYGAVPEAAPVARRPRKALVAALGGAGLLFAAVAVARAPAHEAHAPSTSSFSMTPGVGIGAVEPARLHAAAQKSPGPKKNAYKEGLKTAEQRMAHYRKVVDELNAKAASSKLKQTCAPFCPNRKVAPSARAADVHALEPRATTCRPHIDHV